MDNYRHLSPGQKRIILRAFDKPQGVSAPKVSADALIRKGYVELIGGKLFLTMQGREWVAELHRLP